MTSHTSAQARFPLTSVLVALGLFLAGGTSLTAADQHAEGDTPAHTMGEKLDALFSHRDQNGDGLITRGEFLQSREEYFTEWDKNGDGFLSLEELPKALPHMEDMLEAQKKRWRLGHLRGPHNRLTFLGRHDTDGDEALSREEFMAPLSRRYHNLDENGDGQIERSEAERAVEKHMKMRKQHKNKMRQKHRSNG